MPNTEKSDNIPYQLSRKTNMAWIDPYTGEMPVKLLAGGFIIKNGRPTNKTRKVLVKEFLELTKEPGRYHIDWAWKSKKSGHIITVERFNNGKMRAYDPQNGKIESLRDVLSDLSPRWGINVLRVDNLAVNPFIINEVVTNIK